jgi:hypothetical protein
MKEGTIFFVRPGPRNLRVHVQRQIPVTIWGKFLVALHKKLWLLVIKKISTSLLAIGLKFYFLFSCCFCPRFHLVPSVPDPTVANGGRNGNRTDICIAASRRRVKNTGETSDDRSTIHDP